MNFLLDTQLLIWTVAYPERRSAAADALIEDRSHRFWFSVVGIWEVAIKFRLSPPKIHLDPREMRADLLQHGYRELAVTGAHAMATVELPPIHKDPFDRMLVAQATAEGITLLTTDAVVARYQSFGWGPIRLV